MTARDAALAGRSAWGDDLLAAAVVSVLLIPQSLAYALLAGLPAQVGLYACLLPPLGYALFGTSPVLAVGPAAVLALMIVQAIAGAGVPPETAALVLAAQAGLLLAAAAMLRLDALASLLSVPVLHGFETGASISIALSQVPALIGSDVHGSTLPELLRSVASAARLWHAPTLAFGLVAYALLWLAKRHGTRALQRWMPASRATLLMRLAPLVVLLLGLTMAVALQAPRHGIDTVGALPPFRPALALPALSPSLWWQLFPASASIALVTFVSSLVVAESLGRRQGTRIAPRRELAGLAAANMVAAVSGGMPVAGSFSRSVLMYDAGSRTRWSGVFSCAFIALAAWSLAGPLASLPRAVLAATILAALSGIFALGPFREAWRYSRPEGALMAGVALLTLTVGVGAALAVGVLASIALLLQRTARPHVAMLGRVPGTEHYRNVDRHDVALTPGVVALRIDESLLFTNARPLSDVVLQQLEHQPDTRRVVLLMSAVNRIDFSGLEALQALHESLGVRQIRLDLSEVKGPVLDALARSDWRQWFRGEVYLSHHQAMLAPD